MNNLPPIAEFYNDDMPNLDAFFSNGKKEFWRFNKCKELGIDKCVIFFPRHFKRIKSIYKKCKLIYEFMSASSVSPVYLYDNKVLIALCPLGGPAAANLMEELIFVGIKTFIGTGSCGAIKETDFNKFLIPTKAIRDEGTSYHYLPANKFIAVDKELSKSIANTLTKYNEPFISGITWTTDGLYRETPKRIAARKKDGAICVEMETASLAAVAKAKNVKYACLLYFSDCNNGKEWQTRFYDKYALREKILNISIEALLSF